MNDRSDPAEPWRGLVIAVARALYLDKLADWLAKQRWLIWLDRQPWFERTSRILWRANIVGWVLFPVGVLVAILVTR